MDKMTDEELAYVIASYCKHGDQSTPATEIAKWITELLSESRKGMFTEFAESIKLSLDDEARKMESLYPQHERMVKKFLFRNKMIIDELLTERKGR